MNIYTYFVPTYLYIKQHSVTGLLYFGKTIQDPLKYVGSGTRWVNHINKHGRKYIETTWYCLFLDEEELIKFATNFSTQNNITQSAIWANLRPENGIDGNSSGLFVSVETRHKLSEAGKGRTHSKETLIKMSEAAKLRIRKPLTEEWKINLSKSTKGIAHPIITCPHCGKEGGQCGMKRYHFDNCKLK